MILQELNILRALCILGVLVIHTTSISNSSNLWLLLSDQVSRFSVPGFVFISGYILAYKYNGKKLGKKKYFNNRLLLLGIPYIVWSLIYLLINNRKDITGIFTYNSLFELLTGWGPLFFIIMIFQLYLFYLVFKNSIENNTKKYLFCSIVVSLFYYSLIEILYYKQIILSEADLDTLFIPWLAFFFLGQIMATDTGIRDTVKNKIKLMSLIWFLLLVIDIFDALNHYSLFGHLSLHRYRTLGFFMQFFGVLLLYSISLHLKSNKIFSNVMNKIAVVSFGIYLNHVFFIKVFEKTTGMKHPFPLNFIYVFFMSYVAVTILRRFEILRVIYGK